MKLTPPPGPWTQNTAPPAPIQTDSGRSIRLSLDGSVVCCETQQILASGERAAEWIRKHVRDKSKVYWMTAAAGLGKPVEGYQHNEALANERKRAKGRNRSA